MAERSKAPDSSIQLALDKCQRGFWSPLEAWVRIPLLTKFFISIIINSRVIIRKSHFVPICCQQLVCCHQIGKIREGISFNHSATVAGLSFFLRKKVNLHLLVQKVRMLKIIIKIKSVKDVILPNSVIIVPTFMTLTF